MKKLAVFFGIVLFVIGGCRKIKSIGEATIVVHKQYFEPGTDIPFNGERTSNYITGEIRTKATYSDGYSEIIVNFYRNQQKRAKLVFADGGRGDMIVHIEWYKSGQKKYESADNVIREWYKNGQLKAKANYRNDSGTLHGITKTWYEDGTLKGKESYSYGKLDGERVKWDTDGNKILVQVYEEGKLVES
ncbi:MAG TPA: hypothetical protein VF181_02480 [Balneolaceae bacterium]